MATAGRLRGRLDLALFATCVALSLLALALPPSSVEPIAGALRTTVVSPLVALQHGAQRWRGAWQTRDAESLARDSLTLRLVQAHALRSENEQLRQIVGLAKRIETGFVPALALQASDKPDIVTTVVLSAGSNAGVARYSPVIAAEGLVGSVVTAHPTMSIANLYTNPDFAASAMTADASASGIVYAHIEKGVRARGRQYMMELRGVTDRITLTPGTAIYTSGLGGAFPRGIPIGTVVRQLETIEGLTRSYLVQPAVNPARITAVLILTPERVAQGVGNIWTAAVSQDSATQRIIAAGDSLARNAALIEERARRAVLDSVRMATIDSLLRARGLPADPGDTTSRDSGRPAVTGPPVRRDTLPRPRVDTLRPPAAGVVPVRPDTTERSRSVARRPA